MKNQNENAGAFAARIAEAAEAHKRNDNDRAITLLDSLLPDMEESLGDDHPEMVEVYQLLSFVCLAESKSPLVDQTDWLNRCVTSWEQSVEILRQTGDLEKLWIALHNMGAFYSRAERADEAVAAYEEALQLLEANSPDPTGEKRLATWNHLGCAYQVAGRLDDAERILLKALEITGQTTANASYLMDTLSEVYDAKSTAWRLRALKYADGRT